MVAYSFIHTFFLFVTSSADSCSSATIPGCIETGRVPIFLVHSQIVLQFSSFITDIMHCSFYNE